MIKLDKAEVLQEHARLEEEALKKEVKSLEKEKADLQLHLSAARVQQKYEEDQGVAKKDMLAMNELKKVTIVQACSHKSITSQFQTTEN